MKKILHHLSIDVALGASSMMGLVAAFLQISIPWIYYLLLFLVTWLIYTTDHLMDAKSIPHEASTPRHRFHQKHYKSILSSAIIGLFLFIALIPRSIGNTLFQAGLFISALILLYFLSLLWARKTQFKYVLKELFIALCYVAGIALVPVYLSYPITSMEWVFLLRIFLLALCNLFLFSVMEASIDKSDKHPSAIGFMGIARLRFVLLALLWMNMLTGIVLIPFYWNSTQLVYSLALSAMNLVLMAIYYFPSYFSKNERYRVWGDGVFLLPASYLILVYLLNYFV